MRRIGSRSLSEFPLGVVRIECERRGRAGSDRHGGGLVVRFGTDIALPDLFMAPTTCDRRKDFTNPCAARFTDLAA
jgi:hypothetical protein